MIDPEDQLRRLAEGRAEQVGPFRADELDRSPASTDRSSNDSSSNVVPLFARRWPVAIAAAVLAIAAAGAGAFAVFGGEEDAPFETAEEAPLDAETTSTLLADLAVPDVVGMPAADAVAELEEAGFDAEYSVLFVPRDDPRLGEITRVKPPDVLNVPGVSTVQIEVARLAPSTMAQARCDRPAYAYGDLDGDTARDAIFPTFVDGRITAIEVCTATGAVSSIDLLESPAIDTPLDLRVANDIDLGGFDDIVLRFAGGQSQILTLRSGELQVIPDPMRVGPRADGTNDWWGCYAFAEGAAERLGIGTWWELDNGGIEWVITETFILGGSFRSENPVGGQLEPGTVPLAVPGRVGCQTNTANPDAATCAITDLDVVLVADLDSAPDSDGRAELIAPRDNTVCFSNGEVRPLISTGEQTSPPSIWFLDDVDDDGRPEVFVGENLGDSISVRPYGLDETGALVPVAIDDCCVQDLPSPEQIVGEWYRWFSCVPGDPDGSGSEAGITSGRYRRTDDGTVDWTIDAGPRADAESIYSISLDPGVWGTTDAWVPGNGCRSGSSTWGPTADALSFAADGDPAEFIAAFNAGVAGDDPNRRVVQLRQALDIGRRLEAASSYREDVVQGVFEISGLHDDSVAAERWEFAFAEDGATLVDLTYAWSCQPDRGHADFSTELCI